MLDDRILNRLIEIKIAASGLPKKYWRKRIGIKWGPTFSNYLHGDMAWPEKLKIKAIEVLDLQSVIDKIQERKD
jgi:hypothetical protein